jgi:hypothetical protein
MIGAEGRMIAANKGGAHRMPDLEPGQPSLLARKSHGVSRAQRR